jgi:hypothetical protein
MIADGAEYNTYSDLTWQSRCSIRRCQVIRGHIGPPTGAILAPQLMCFVIDSRSVVNQPDSTNRAPDRPRRRIGHNGCRRTHSPFELAPRDSSHYRQMRRSVRLIHLTVQSNRGQIIGLSSRLRVCVSRQVSVSTVCPYDSDSPEPSDNPALRS